MKGEATVASPRPVYCVTAHERRDLSVADQVCAGIFTFAGISRHLGTRPDWLGADLPPDEEWWIEWNKFYYGLDLAHAFAATGEPRFLTAWESLVRSWIEQVPIHRDPADVAARRIQNWIYAWQAFARVRDFQGLGDELDRLLVESIGAQARYVRAELAPERNHRTLALYALLIVALALPELDPDGELCGFAVAELHRNLRDDFRADGVHREASTHYHMIALRSFLGARANCDRYGVELPQGFDSWLERACDFALHCQHPDGAIPALSDADSGRYGELLVLAGELLGREDLLYAGSAGVRGRPPGRRYVSFPSGGYFVQRSGWGEAATELEEERFLIFDCGPLGDGGHGHYDLLSVELSAGGRQLVVDPGRYTYSEETPNMRHWFKGTKAHNTVCVDGLDQTPYRRGRPGEAVAQGRLLGRLSAPGLDVVSGEAVSPVYEAVHTRRVAFVADEYWIVEDRLEGVRPHRYDLRFHLAPDAHGVTSVECRAAGTLVRAPGVALVFAPGPAVAIEPGWVAPVYGELVDAPVVSAVVDGVAQARFVTLVVPVGPRAAAPLLAVGQDAGGRTVVEVDGTGSAGVRDVVTWSDSRATATWRRQSAAGKCVAFQLAGAGGDR